MPTATVTSKGQITIPKAIREHLDVKAGDEVDFTLNERGDVVVRSATGNIRDLRGFLKRSRKRPVNVEAMNAGIEREHARKR